MKANNTRARILEAALKSFSKKGYLGATTREIAREAGIAEVTLFRHFPSKEKLFEEVISAHSFLPTLKGLLPAASTMSFEEALTLIAVRFLETLNLRKDMIRIMHSEMQRYPEKIHRIYHAFVDEVRDTLASYFSDLQREGVLRQFDAALGARAFFGMFLSYFNAEEFLMRKKYRSTDVDETIRQYVGIFVKGTMK
jgi:AcrR family transcriptional regulator